MWKSEGYRAGETDAALSGQSRGCVGWGGRKPEGKVGTWEPGDQGTGLGEAGRAGQVAVV